MKGANRGAYHGYAKDKIDQKKGGYKNPPLVINLTVYAHS